MLSTTEEHYRIFFIWKDREHTRKRRIESPDDELKTNCGGFWMVSCNIWHRHRMHPDLPAGVDLSGMPESIQGKNTLSSWC